MSTEVASGRAHRLTAVLRQEETVTPLELFFDLVFVLALTQCTALMAAEPTWAGLAKGMLVLGVLWWSWVGYAWLTSVIDPEEGAVRLVIFAAMAAMLVAALCVPRAFGDAGLIFAIAYAFVRIAHIGLFVLGSTQDEHLRRSVIGLGMSTAVGIGLLVAASFTDGLLQGGLWALALVLDMAGPAFFGVEGWQLSAHHFAERHGLILIIALGESIVAIGVGVEGAIDLGVVTAAVVGTAIAAALWWLYFDVVALVAGRRLASAEPGREQNAIARDSYSFLHFPMVAGIVLVALGMKKTLGHVEEPLKLVAATALFGGTALYLLAHVAFRYRQIQTLNTRRLGLAVLLVALIAVAGEVSALVSIASSRHCSSSSSCSRRAATARTALVPAPRFDTRASTERERYRLAVPGESELRGGLRGLFATARKDRPQVTCYRLINRSGQRAGTVTRERPDQQGPANAVPAPRVVASKHPRSVQHVIRGGPVWPPEP